MRLLARLRSSLRGRLIAFAFVTSAAALFAASVAIVVMTASDRWRDLVQTVDGQAMALAETCDVALVFGLPEDAAVLLETAQANPAVVQAAVYDERNQLFAAHSLGETPDTLLSSETADQSRWWFARTVRAIQPIRAGGDVVGSVLLVANTGRVIDGMVRDVQVIFLITLVVLGGAFLVALRLQSSVSEPILELVAAARDVSSGDDYSMRVTRRTTDETGELVDAFNEMLGVIQVRDAQLRGLTADLERRVRERTGQLEAANKELEAFAYSVSHDLRAPLRHITGFISLLKEGDRSALSASGQRYLDIIDESAARMGMLIDELLTFSRVGRSELSRGPVDLDGLIRGVIEELHPEVPVEWRVASMPSVRGDATLLRQVFSNLIENAVKFTSTRDRPEISVAAEDDGDGMVQIDVSDNGVGFDPQYAHKLFGVFQRLHRASDFEGVGIGLAIVRRIVERHGGSVWARGAVDGGATFSFTLPLTAHPREDHE